MRTRVKICGLTRAADIVQVASAGADAIGFIFFPQSKRHVTPALAAQLRREVPAFVDVVALFVNPQPDEVRVVLDEVGPDLLQFHGDESHEFCASFDHRYMRAFRAGAPSLDTAAAVAAQSGTFRDAAAWLYDSHSAGFGGSGHGFDYGLLAGVQADPQARPLVLAGGLTADNVGDAIAAVRPWAVDVSSGVESAPGQKSADKVEAFLRAVRQADAK